MLCMNGDLIGIEVQNKGGQSGYVYTIDVVSGDRWGANLLC